jgi:hypothetical protein
MEISCIESELEISRIETNDLAFCDISAIDFGKKKNIEEFSPPDMLNKTELDLM